MDWDKLKSFHASAETGSLTAAAERLGISQSAVSRQIAALEEEVGVPLFQRHARGLILTGAGHTLHKSTEEMAAAATLAASALQDASGAPEGELTVTAPIAFGSTWLVPRLGRFNAAYPDLSLNLRLDDREYDLLKLEAECAIRLWAATKADLIQRKLATVRTSLYAAADYLAAHGEPTSAPQLDDHTIIVYGSGGGLMSEVNWAQRVGRDDRPPRKAAFSINNIFAMVRAVEAGLGIAALPDYMVSGMEGRVRKIIPEEVGPHFDLYFIYPSDLRRSKRIAAFRDFLTREIADLV
jgi:DNA-binding transcriptional LysR family regulator